MKSLFPNPKSIAFRDAATAAKWLLVHVGESHWAKHFSRNRNGGDSFRSAFGGMGSLNDLVLCQANHHVIRPHQEPIANELLLCLCAISYELCRGGQLSPDAAIDACGSMGNQLSGCRCRACGYALVSERSLLSLSAYYEARMAIRTGIERSDVPGAVMEAMERVEPTSGSARFRHHAEAAGINFSSDSGWVRPCPACGSEDTCVYRWDYDGRDFTEADNNLEINKR